MDMAQVKTLKLKTTDEVVEHIRSKFPKSPIKEIGYLTLEELLELSKPQPQEAGRAAWRDRLKRIEHYGYSPYVAFVIRKLYDPVVPYVVLPPPARLSVLSHNIIFNVVQIDTVDSKSCEQVIAEIDAATGYAVDYIYSVLCGDISRPPPVPPPPPPRAQEEEEKEEEGGEEEEGGGEGGKEGGEARTVYRQVVPKELIDLWNNDEVFRDIAKTMAEAENVETAFYKLGIALERLAKTWPELKRRMPTEGQRPAAPPAVAPPKCDVVEAIVRTYGLPEEARGRVDALMVTMEPLLQNIHNIPETAFKRIIQALSRLSA